MKRDAGQIISDADRRVLRSGQFRRLNGTDVLFSMPRAIGTGSSYVGPA